VNDRFLVHRGKHYKREPLQADLAAQLPEIVLYRIAKRDAKGRAFGTPRNPHIPALDELNAGLVDIPAGDLAELIVARRHGIFPDQAEQVKQFSNEGLLQFRLEDPISASWQDGLSLTGGHHRMNEIAVRVQDGRIDPRY
jgi:hypothetical protein